MLYLHSVGQAYLSRLVNFCGAGEGAVHSSKQLAVPDQHLTDAHMIHPLPARQTETRGSVHEAGEGRERGVWQGVVVTQ